ncbi:MAG TPA: DUF1003 domain-containing protein [Gemmatimonadaceae bacterium]|nr:DUF1003 domain-containing protein [Gemmatimonadaceae bacterium]
MATDSTGAQPAPDAGNASPSSNGASSARGGAGGSASGTHGDRRSAARDIQNERRQRRVGTNRARRAIKAEHFADRSFVERVADGLTRFASSTPFLLLHTAWFLVWIPWNTGFLGLRPFDPYPFGLLTMIVSLEAIFLSIFVLMAQNRESAIAELREEITLQVNLRMEEEVTKTLQLVAGLYTRMGHRLGDDPELRDMLQPLDSREIERDLTRQILECSKPQKWHSRAAAKAGVTPEDDVCAAPSPDR